MNKSLRTRLFGVLLISLIFVFQACKKEESSSPIAGVKNTISVTVTDQNGIAVSGVSLKLNNQISGTSNDAGMFTFKDVTASDSRYFVVSTAYGYFNASQSVELQNGKSGDIRMILTAKGSSYSVDGVSGGTVNFPGGTKVVFPANGFQTVSGANYTGTVKVYLTHYDPTSVNFSMRMPGGADMAGIRTDGSLSTLVSYGAISVELENGTGDKIKLKSGQKAQITMPIPASMAASAPASIPLWHFDEAKGKWSEEGVATKVGSFYQGEVSHFSSWNCDLPVERATVKGKVVDCNGNPMPGVPVYVGPNTLVSNEDGSFERFVPTGIDFTANAGWPGFMTNTFNISSLSSGQIVDVGNLQMVHCLIPVTGTVVNCDNQSTAFIATYSFSSGGGYSQNLSNQSGTIHFGAVPGTQMNVAFFSLVDNSFKFTSVAVPLTGSLTLGEVKVCNPVGSDPFFSCKIDNIPCLFNPLVETQSFGTFNNTFRGDSTYIYALASVFAYKPVYSTGRSFIGISNSSALEGTYVMNENSQRQYDIYIDMTSGNPIDPNLSLYAINGDLVITEYGPIGGRVEGTFKGTFRDYYTDTDYIVTEGKFSIRRQQ